MASRLSRLLPLLFITLLCIGVVEGGYLLFEYFLFRQPAEETVAPGVQAAKEMPPPAGAKRDSRIILTRNLFGSEPRSDRPAPAPAVDVAALDKTDLEVVLVGTVDGTAGTHRAIIYDKKTRKQDLFKEGDQVKGARIKEVRRGKVILDVEGKEELLDMSEAASVRPAVQVVQAPQPRPMPPPVRPRGLVQPRSGGQAPAVEAAPGVEGAAETFFESEPGGETGSEAVSPEDAGPENAEAVVPGETPEGEEAQAPQPRIVRPRIIRPHRSP